MTAEIEATDPPIRIDPQDPLPESNWLWRRLLTFAIVIFIAWQLWRIVGFMKAEADNLLTLSKWLIVAWLVTVLLYMIAPSAEQVAKMLATLSAWKSGIATTVTSKVDAIRGTAETKTAAGPVAAAAALATPSEELPEYARP